MKVYVAIPVYNHYDLTIKRLYELMRVCSDDIECVYVINDASTDDTHEMLKWWTNGATKLKVQEIPIEQNKGFLLCANYGLKTIAKNSSPDDIVVLLSSDVQVTGNFIQQIVQQYSDKKLFGARFLYQDTGWNKFGDKLFPYLEGWMLATTVAGWEEIGYFDPRFAPNDYEDIDLTTTAVDKGFELVLVGEGMLHHAGGATLGYTEARREQTMRNKQKFMEKWVK